VLLAFHGLFQPVKLALDESVRVSTALLPIFHGASRSREARAERGCVFAESMAERLYALWSPPGIRGRHGAILYCWRLLVSDRVGRWLGNPRLQASDAHPARCGRWLGPLT
jgi:hypothetical protein